MLEKLSYAKETLDLYCEEIKNKSLETNDMLIEDILLALGYMRKRNKGVREAHDTDAIHWTINDGDETRFIIKVLGYTDDEPDRDLLADMFHYMDENKYRFGVVTDGNWVSVYEGDQKLIHIDSIYSDEADELLNLLSKDGWDTIKLSQITYGKILTSEFVKQTLIESENDIAKLVIEQSGIAETNDVIEFTLNNVRKVLESIKNMHNDLSDDIIVLSQGNEEAYDNTDEDKEKLQNELYELNIKLSGLDTKCIQLEEALVKSDELSSNKSEEIRKLLDKVSQLNAELDAAKNENKDLRNRLSALIEEGETLKTELNTLKLQEANVEDMAHKVKSLEEALDNKEIEVSRLKDHVGILETKNSELAEKLEEAASINVTLPTQQMEDTFKNKIRDLTAENQHLKSDLTEALNLVSTLEEKLNGSETEQEKMARQLLDAVSDNLELPRTYVGVVNSKLFQIADIRKFVGTCIQELYSVVNFNLMTYLFDGDIFKLSQPAIRKDLMIGTKSYDLDFKGLSEDEVLNKLNTFFDKFDTVVFKCKTIGAKNENSIENEYDNTLTADAADDITKALENASSTDDTEFDAQANNLDNAFSNDFDSFNTPDTPENVNGNAEDFDEIELVNEEYAPTYQESDLDNSSDVTVNEEVNTDNMIEESVDYTEEFKVSDEDTSDIESEYSDIDNFNYPNIVDESTGVDDNTEESINNTNNTNNVEETKPEEPVKEKKKFSLFKLNKKNDEATEEHEKQDQPTASADTSSEVGQTQDNRMLLEVTLDNALDIIKQYAADIFTIEVVKTNDIAFRINNSSPEFAVSDMLGSVISGYDNAFEVVNFINSIEPSSNSPLHKGLQANGESRILYTDKYAAVYSLYDAVNVVKYIVDMVNSRIINKPDIKIYLGTNKIDALINHYIPYSSVQFIDDISKTDLDKYNPENKHISGLFTSKRLAEAVLMPGVSSIFNDLVIDHMALRANGSQFDVRETIGLVSFIKAQLDKMNPDKAIEILQTLNDKSRATPKLVVFKPEEIVSGAEQCDIGEYTVYVNPVSTDYLVWYCIELLNILDNPYTIDFRLVFNGGMYYAVTSDILPSNPIQALGYKILATATHKLIAVKS